MAQVITTKKAAPVQPARKAYGKKKEAPRTPLFHKTNYILMIVGAVVLFAGYIALRGGASEDPSKFSKAIFDTRRLNVAPILMLIGLVTEIFAIMWTPCQKKKAADTDNCTDTETQE